MRGISIDHLGNPPLDRILIEANNAGIKTAALYDGGNEAGSGNTRDKVPPILDMDGLVIDFTSVVSSDFQATAWNSNLAAIQVAGWMYTKRGMAERLITPEQYWTTVQATVNHGAVDGVNKQPNVAQVDGFDFQRHADDINALNEYLRSQSRTGR